MTPEEIRTVADHLKLMMDAMYAGKSVLTPTQFKADVDALLRASGLLHDLATEKEGKS